MMTDRDYALAALAEREVAYQLDVLGYSPRIIRGAVKDAGDLDGYATVQDYQEAMAAFANVRRRHARWRLPGPGVTRS